MLGGVTFTDGGVLKFTAAFNFEHSFPPVGTLDVAHLYTDPSLYELGRYQRGEDNMPEVMVTQSQCARHYTASS